MIFLFSGAVLYSEERILRNSNLFLSLSEHSVQQEKVEAMFIAVPPQLVGLILILLAAFASGSALHVSPPLRVSEVDK